MRSNRRITQLKCASVLAAAGFSGRGCYTPLLPQRGKHTVKHPYLTTRADSTHYYFRRKVPLQLRPLLDRTEIWLSLETPCQTEAITRR